MEKLRKGRSLGLLFALIIFFAGISSAHGACDGSVSISEPTVEGNNVTVTASNNTNEALYVCFYYGQRAGGQANLPVAKTAQPLTNGDVKVTATIKTDDYIKDSGIHAVVVRGANTCNSDYSHLGSNAVCDKPLQIPSALNGTGKTADDNNGDKDNPTPGTTYTKGDMTGVSIDDFTGAGNFTTLVQNILKWLLSVAGAVALLMLIYGGIIYITSTGDQAKAEQGKKIVTWTIAGLLVILMSYSIILVLDQIFAQTK
jgi:hypothetical protein